MEFKEEYNDPNSRAYKNLVANLTIELKNVYKKVDGFVDIHILYITKGSVICSFIVILAKNSQVKEEKLKEVLEQAQKDGTFTFEVKSIEVVEEPTKKPEQKLPEWALITIIVLASLAFVFLVTVICVCVSIFVRIFKHFLAEVEGVSRPKILRPTYVICLKFRRLKQTETLMILTVMSKPKPCNCFITHLKLVYLSFIR